MKERKHCFFEKKQQKTFIGFGLRVFHAHCFRRAKVFCGAFFQKSDLLPKG
jgi:hypothetical protein